MFQELFALVEILGDAFLSNVPVTRQAYSLVPERLLSSVRSWRLADERPNLHSIGLTEVAGQAEICFFAEAPEIIDFLPEKIEGLKTRICPALPASVRPPDVRPFLVAEAWVRIRDSAVLRQRPVQPGLSCGHPLATAGTLACICRSTIPGEEGAFGLSNNHVLANANRASIGDIVLQPGAIDGGSSPADKFGTLSHFSPLAFGLEAANTVDCALARLTTDFEPAFPNIGLLNGTGTPAIGQQVRKLGRTTGLTHGLITHVAYTTVVNYQGKLTRFSNQIRIAAADPNSSFSAGGDSGAVILDSQAPVAVGLLFAGAMDGSYSLANPIDLVLAKLNIAIS